MWRWRTLPKAIRCLPFHSSSPSLRARDSYSTPCSSGKLVLGENVLLAFGTCLHWRCSIGKCRLPSMLRRRRELTKLRSSSSDCLSGNPGAMKASGYIRWNTLFAVDAGGGAQARGRTIVHLVEMKDTVSIPWKEVDSQSEELEDEYLCEEFEDTFDTQQHPPQESKYSLKSNLLKNNPENTIVERFFWERLD
jgi:hypothetical protein